MFGRNRRSLPEVDQGGRTELHYAAADGKVNSLRQLLADGVDVDPRDNDDCTPLHFAAINQCDECVLLLLDAGAEIDAVDNKGNTPLFYATTYSQGAGGCIQPLLAAGADPHHRNRYDSSPRKAAQDIANFDILRWYEGER